MRTVRRLVLAPALGVLAAATIGGCSFGQPDGGAVDTPSNPWSTVRTASTSSSPRSTPTSSSASTTSSPSTTTPLPTSTTTTSSSTPSSTTTSTTPTTTSSSPQRTDQNGFVLGGPSYPAGPSDYYHPSPTECVRFNTQLHQWSNYQNSHRPANDNQLPSSGDLQYLDQFCSINYDATP